MEPYLQNVSIIKSKKIFLWRTLYNQRLLHLMVLPGIIFLIIFNYIPVAGLFTAFQEYNPIKGITKSPFVGFAQFEELFKEDMFWASFKNTIGLSMVKITISFFAPIICAILINEVTRISLKKLVQTASYLPHFISWVIVGGLFTIWLNSDGIINHLLTSLNIIDKPQGFLNNPSGFWFWMALIDTWKETGWWAIIYIAAIAGIPPELYESASVDGAGRIRRIISITIPSIKDTIFIVLILSVGSLIYGGLTGSNLNQSLLFGNTLNYESSMILETYVIRMGLSLGRFSYATAAGLIQSIISLMLFSLANYSCRKIAKSSLY